LLASTLSGLALLTVAWPLTHMSVAAFGEDENTQRLSVVIELEENFTLAEAEVEMEHYERYFTERKADYGFDHIANRFDPRGGRISLYWDGSRSREQHKAVEDDVRKSLVPRPGHRMRLWSDESGSNERNKNIVTFRLVGPDSEELARLGEEAVRLLERVDGLTGISQPDNQGQSQLRVQFDSDLAQGFGISPDTALQNIAWALRGWQLPRYQEQGREVPLIIEYDDEEVAGLDTLRELEIYAQDSAVPLSSFAQFAFARGERRIERRNGQTSFTIQARVQDTMRQKELSEAGYAALRGLELPRGYAIGEEDLVAQRQEQELQTLLFALVLGLLLSYIVMAILFESLLLPFAVMFTVPYAMLGAFWTLYVTRTPMDSVGWIGMIILGGVVAKNGIVLVDCVQRLRDGGLERSAAVLQGGALRLRPVLMTALATVLGLVPMAVAEPPSDGIDYRALATLLAGGLSVTTIFTLWVVPLAYTLSDDAWNAVGLWVRTVLHVVNARRAGADHLAGEPTSLS
jgi:HAE1 family hydrophobic/amphiphilic exporter-1